MTQSITEQRLASRDAAVDRCLTFLVFAAIGLFRAPSLVRMCQSLAESLYIMALYG